MNLFKRAPKTILLCVLCLCLTACAAGPEAPEVRVRALRRPFSDGAKVQGRAVLTADYGERVYTWTVAIDGSAQAGSMTVEEPDNIAGTVLQWSDGSTSLSCEDVTLETGPLSDRLSPADAIPTLLSICQSGQVLECGWEDELLYAKLSHPTEEGINALCWFGEDTLRRCELTEEGKTLLTLDFSDFTLSDGDRSSPSDAIQTE